MRGHRVIALALAGAIAAGSGGCTLVGAAIGGAVGRPDPAPAPAIVDGPPGLVMRAPAPPRRRATGSSSGSIKGALVGLVIDGLLVAGLIYSIKNLDLGLQGSWGPSSEGTGQ